MCRGITPADARSTLRCSSPGTALPLSDDIDKSHVDLVGISSGVPERAPNVVQHSRHDSSKRENRDHAAPSPRIILMASWTVVMNWAGKIIVEFFSMLISAMVCRVRS